MKDSRTLFQLTTDMAALEDELMENGGELTPEIEAMLEATQEALVAKADGYNTLLRKLKAEEAMCDTEAKYWAGKKKVAGNAQKRLREHITEVMTAFDIRKIEGEHCKISRTERAGLEVDEEVLLADAYRKVEEFRATLPDFVQVELKVSKTALKEWIEREGITPAGVCTRVDSSITIR